MLKAEKRAVTGKNNNRRLRVNGMIPAIMYSHGEAETLSVNAKEFGSVFKGHISESVILTLSVDGKDHETIVKDYQRNPISGDLIHLDFYKVTAGEKIHTIIPIEFTGSAVGVKKGGVFEPVEREVEVEVLPRELPEKIVVDVTNLEIGESVHISDLKVPESMTFKQDADHVLAHVIIARSAAADEDEEDAEEESETV